MKKSSSVVCLTVLGGRCSYRIGSWVGWIDQIDWKLGVPKK